MKGVTLHRQSERGAAAVEFALIVPLLIMLVFGIMEFGRAYSVHASLANAAREGTRSIVLNKNQDTSEQQAKARAAARAAAQKAASHLNPALADIDISFNPSHCTGGTQMTVNIKYKLSTVTGFTGPFTLAGRGTMLCGG